MSDETTGLHWHHDRHGHDSYRRNVIADFEYFDLQHGSHLD
jgi:hypothetical protein